MTLGALNPLGLTFPSQELFPKQMQTYLVWNKRNLQDQSLVPSAELPSPSQLKQLASRNLSLFLLCKMEAILSSWSWCRPDGPGVERL